MREPDVSTPGEGRRSRTASPYRAHLVFDGLEYPPSVVSVDGGPKRFLWVQLVGYEIVDPVELALEIWLGTIPGHGLTLSLAFRGPEYLR